MESATMESATMESATMESATMESATMESATPAVKATAATVETSGVGGIRLAQRASAQHSSGDCQSPSYPGLRPAFD
jgi:hypothetical protein